MPHCRSGGAEPLLPVCFLMQGTSCPHSIPFYSSSFIQRNSQPCDRSISATCFVPSFLILFFTYTRQGKGVLVSVTLAAAGVIYAVHYDQVRQQTEMKKGIERDRLRVENKKQQNSTGNQQQQCSLFQFILHSHRSKMTSSREEIGVEAWKISCRLQKKFHKRDHGLSARRRN